MSIEITKVTETDVYFREVRENSISEGGMWREKFVEQAYMRARNFGDKRALNQAIKHGLTELLDEQYRDLLQEIIGGKPPIKKHHNSYLMRHEKKIRIWGLLHYWHGYGLALKNATANDRGRDDACGRVAKQVCLNYDSVWKEYYRPLKKINDDLVSRGAWSSLEFEKKENLLLGQMVFICEQVFISQDQDWLENGVKVTLEDIIRSAATKLSIDSKAALNLYGSCKKLAEREDKSLIAKPLEQVLQARGYKLP